MGFPFGKREELLQQFRYFRVDPPGRNPPPSPNTGNSTNQTQGSPRPNEVRVSTGDLAREISQALPKTGFTPQDRMIQSLLNAVRDSGGALLITPRPDLRGVVITIIPPDALHIDPSVLYDLISQLPHSDFQHLPSFQSTEGQTNPLWLNLPQNANTQEAAQTIVRQLFQSGNIHQESLKSFLMPGQTPASLQGGQFVSGVTLSFPPEHLAAMLLPFTTTAESPEMAKAVMIAQALLPTLIGFQPNGATLANLLQTALRSDNVAQPTGEKILASFANLISKNGLISFEEVKTLFKAFLEAENLRTGGSDAAGSISEQLQRLTQRLAASNHPQMMGLAEFAPNQPNQGLNQILNSVLRLLMGVMILNPQNQWPHALPLESMLLELKRFIGPPEGKSDTKKWKEKLKKQAGRRIADEEDEDDEEDEPDEEDEEEGEDEDEEEDDDL